MYEIQILVLILNKYMQIYFIRYFSSDIRIQLILALFRVLAETNVPYMLHPNDSNLL